MQTILRSHHFMITWTHTISMQLQDNLRCTQSCKEKYLYSVFKQYS